MKATLAAIVLAAVLAAPAAALPRSPADVQASAALAVTKTLQESASTFARGDLEAASKVWSHSEALTVFESGHVNVGWRDYRDNHLGPEMKELHDVSYRLTNIVPHVIGDTAWATFRYAIAGRDADGRTFKGTGLGTAVLERSAHTWRIVHWHTTSSPKPKATQPPPNAG